MPDTVYLDYAATTPPSPDVVEAMMPHLSGQTGNPHARHHANGATADKAVRAARASVAAMIGATTEELFFTSGATEGNNMIIFGLAAHLKAVGKSHIITSAVEHKSVLEPLQELQKQGFKVTILPVLPCGMVEDYMIEQAITDETGLVCVQAVNNETGTIQPLSEIAAMLAGRDILLHVDAAQGPGKTAIDIQTTGADFMTMSAHKMHGPQGIGAVYIKQSRQNAILPLLYGGGQQRGMRPGTLPVALCVGFGQACASLVDDRSRLQGLRTLMLDRFSTAFPDMVVYGHTDPEWQVPGILNIGFPDIDHDALVMALPDLAFGIGSACNGTDSEKLSHVIQACAGNRQAARESIRLSFGRYTTENEIEQAITRITDAVKTIQDMKEVA